MTCMGQRLRERLQEKRMTQFALVMSKLAPLPMMLMTGCEPLPERIHDG